MIHELKVPAKKTAVRRGRGISAGRGKTAGRGTKGQNSRTGGGVRPGFEGGQNPLVSRIPKLPGFTSRRPASQTVTTTMLNSLSGKRVDFTALSEAKLIRSQYRPVKLVAGDAPKKAFSVELSGATAGARQLIEAAGGSFKAVQTPRRAGRPKPSAKQEG